MMPVKITTLLLPFSLGLLGFFAVLPEWVGAAGGIAGNDRVPLDQILQAQIQEVAQCDPNEKLELKGEACLFTGYDSKFQEVVRSLDELRPVLDRVIYRDISRFIVQRIWDSYVLAFLSDPSLRDVCARAGGDPKRVKAYVEDLLKADLALNQPSQAKSGLANLKSCFAGASQDYTREIGNLGVGDRVTDLIDSTSAVVCTGAFLNRSAGGSCHQADRAKNDAVFRDLSQAQEQNFLTLSQKLKQIRSQRESLREGRGVLEGKRLLCPGPWGDWAGFLERMRECAPSYRRAGCVPPDALNENLDRVWKASLRLQRIEDEIYRENPELRVEITVALPEGKVQKMKAWESLEALGAIDGAQECTYGKSKRPCTDVVRYQLDAATQASRRQKLQVITQQACQEPREFAQKILLDEPELVKAFLKKKRHRDMGKMVCMAMKEAQSERDFDRNVDLAMGVGSIALGIAAAIPTHGASLATLGALAEGTSIGLGVSLTAKSLSNSYSRLREEEGLFQGCVGDLARLRLAEEELENAAFSAQLELGLGAGFFAGMTALQKVKTLRRLSDRYPAWSVDLGKTEDLLLETSRTQLRELDETFQLRELGLLDSAGNLTSDGKKTIEQVRSLEAMGVSRSQIQEFMRSCSR